MNDEIQQKLLLLSRVLGGLYCTNLLICVAYLTVTIVFMPTSNQCLFVTGSIYCYVSLGITVVFAVCFAAGFFLWLMFCFGHPKRAQLIPIIRRECRVPIIVFGQVGLSVVSIIAWIIIPSVAISHLKYVDQKAARDNIDMEKFARARVVPYAIVGYFIAILSVAILVVLCLVFKAYIALPWPLVKTPDEEPEEMRFQELKDKNEVEGNDEKRNLKDAEIIS